MRRPLEITLLSPPIISFLFGLFFLFANLWCQREVWQRCKETRQREKTCHSYLVHPALSVRFPFPSISSPSITLQFGEDMGKIGRDGCVRCPFPCSRRSGPHVHPHLSIPFLSIPFLSLSSLSPFIHFLEIDDRERTGKERNGMSGLFPLLSLSYPPSISFLSLLHVLVLVFGVTCRLLKL